MNCRARVTSWILGLTVSALTLSGEPPAPVLPPPAEQVRILVFTRTEGFRHDSIPAGIDAFRELAVANGWFVEATEDPERFTAELLKPFKAVVFLNTTGDVLDPPHEAAFEAFIRNGGGYLGIHSASDTEYDWPFYKELVGAHFKRHPAVQQATVMVEDQEHPATRLLPHRWTRTDEWYDFRALPEAPHRVLARLDPASYTGSEHTDDHPIVWCREIDAGRALYTGCGHTKESFKEPLFREHLSGSIRWLCRLADSAPGDGSRE